MSVFRVKLNNAKQGNLDLDPSTGKPYDPSLQRQIYAPGPNGTYRLLKDGETFTDCNYWKKFTAEQMGEEFAFIEVVSDDGSVFSYDPDENVRAVGNTETLTTNFADTEIDFVNTYGGPAKFLQVKNLDTTINVEGQLNGDANVTFTLGPGETQIFNNGDLMITKLNLKGASGTPQAHWLASVKIACQS